MFRHCYVHHMIPYMSTVPPVCTCTDFKIETIIRMNMKLRLRYNQEQERWDLA